ncbi:hypothetical protein [Rathayibacter festucae]|uniref:hypothetical protein n=1 Tax=Rathayibacter festucae TaxID=110937 RepID=UPI000FD75B0C|nr:hypothetical protein [Rathayibacter festucae]
MANKINIVISADDKASKPIRGVADELDNATGSSGRLSSALGSLGGVLGTTAVAAGGFAIAGAGAGIAIGFGFNSAVEQATTKLQAFMGDNERVAKTLDWVKREAALTQFSFTDMADAAANLTPVAKSSGTSLEDLVKQAEVLAAVNPAEGLTGATFSLREALSGDWVSIIDRFNLPRKRINELKEQGVPAMEIISKTLGEMGINYDLVEKQGKTVSARFDQVKDKLVMMAGEATKPIFDRVSESLSALGSFDYGSLGKSLSGVMSGAITQFDNFVISVRDVSKQVGEYLMPKLTNLWTKVKQDLMPALDDLWKNVIAPLAQAIGVGLVGAFGLAIDAITLAMPIVSGLITFLSDNTWIIWGVVGAVVAFKSAMAIEAAVSAFTASIAIMTGGSGLGGLLTTFLTTKAAMLLPIALPAIAVGAAIAAIALVKQAHDEMTRAVEGQQASIRTSLDATQTALNRNVQVQSSGVYSLETKQRFQAATDSIINMNKKAIGTNFAAGGTTLVGEHGPELVNLPAGSQVTPAWKTASQASSEGAGAPSITINGNVILQNAAAVDSFFKQADQAQRFARMGMA